METDLRHLPFDHFQRYGTAVAVLEQLAFERSHILEVGANRQRLLSQAMPGATVIYSDVEPSGGGDLVLASATALPFDDGAFDAVVCLDVLEHIPAELRQQAVSEMARVCSGVVVIGCPIDRTWVKDAEAEANKCWARLFEGDYPWLAEHQEYGLVDAPEVESTLRERMPHVLRASQGAPGLWSALMRAHFMKERVPSLAPLVSSLDRIYNAHVFDWDFPEHGYREYFIGLRSAGHAERVSSWLASSRQPAEELAAFLQTMPDVIQPVVESVVRAEAEWASTVRLYRDQARDLETTKVEWGKTASHLAAVNSDCARLRRDLDAATAGWQETVSAVDALREREHALEHDFSVARAGWQEAVDALRAAEGAVVEARAEAEHLRADLAVAKTEWATTSSLLDTCREESRARIARLAAELDQEREGRELAEHAAQHATEGRRRARLALGVVVVVVFVAIVAAAFL